MTSLPCPVPLLDSLACLAQRYDAWICDVWGVLHNGVRAFGRAVDACSRFRASGGSVLLLTNAPRPAAAVQMQLDGLGVGRDAYDLIVTSGDLTRELIRGREARRLFHIGPERDKGLFTGLDIDLAGEEDTDLIVCSGLFDDTVETPVDYAPVFRRLVGRQVPMLCANPDLTVERGDHIIYCAGSLAAAYEQLGGRVTYAGKPHLPIYDLAIARLAALRGAEPDRRRILAIGDGLRTDIKGAANAGVDSLFIASAIHVPGVVTPASLAELFARSDLRPVAAQAGLAW